MQMSNQERQAFWDLLNSFDGKNPVEEKEKLTNSIKYPRYLYRFRTVSNSSLDALRSNKMLFSRADYFDDPFDSFLHIDADRVFGELNSLLTDKSRLEAVVRQLSTTLQLPYEPILQSMTSADPEKTGIASLAYLKQIREQIQKEFHMVCFSEDGLNEVLWLKYAGNHSGFSLEYDIADDTAFLCGNEEKCSNCISKEHRFSLYPVFYSDTKYDATVFARAIATYNLTLQMSGEVQEKIMQDLGPQLWEREKIALIKKRCHEHDTEWRALLTYAPSARPMVKWRPSSITLGLRCKEPERSLVIEMAKTAGISQIYECYINNADELDRRALIVENYRPELIDFPRFFRLVLGGVI